jgi:hypothetical protein
MSRFCLCVLLAAAAGCQRDKAAPAEKAAASDPHFDQQWSSLQKGGTEPLYIEGDLHGAGLMGEVRRAVDTPPDSAIGARAEPWKGQLPDDQVVRVIRQNLGAVKGCYAVEERAGTVGSGKAIVSLEINQSGEVSEVKVDAPAFRESKLPACVSTRAKGWTFPKFTEGPKKFSYPFVFVGG